MRITHVCRTGWPRAGGMERVVHELAREQRARGHQVDVLTLAHGVDNAPMCHHQGVPYRRVQRWGPRRYPCAHGLIEAVRGAQIVHVHGLDGLADLLAWDRSHGARVGISTHGGFLHTQRHTLLKSLWLRSITRLTLQRADAVWYTSSADAHRIGGPTAQRGSVLVDGVDIQRLQHLQRSPVRGRWLLMGRVDRHKGHADLIDTLAALPAPITLIVVGPERIPALRRELSLRAAAAGVSVHFRGEVDDARLLQELAQAELAVFPSHFEGFGVGVIEAMAAGVPVAVSPAHDHLITPDLDALRVDFRQPSAAAVTLALRLREDPSARIAAARQTASRYDWSELIPRWDAAYRALIGPPDAP